MDENGIRRRRRKPTKSVAIRRALIDWMDSKDERPLLAVHSQFSSSLSF